MTLAHKIQGESMQMVVVQLDDGQRVYAEAGKFLWKTVNVAVETRLGKAGPGEAEAAPAQAGTAGLINKAVKTGLEMGKRHLAGESVAFQHFTARGGSGLAAFAGTLPGTMRAIELDGTMGWTAEKDAFVCAESTVDFDIAFQGWKAGRKSGEGFVLEKFTGVGTLLIAGAGNFIELNPAKYGGTIEVDTGCVVAFQDSIAYEVKRVGALNSQALVAAMFAGQGLSVATLSGDGTVILQSMTYDGMANALFARVGQHDSTGITGGIFGTSKG
ncbi:MAG TPA: AIM24 family protein [Acidimicrobiales bacterium]|nr:AIM24 family protein [Acidimicrobiales bacterium]